jgi:hypothetical protein
VGRIKRSAAPATQDSSENLSCRNIVASLLGPAYTFFNRLQRG